MTAAMKVSQNKFNFNIKLYQKQPSNYRSKQAAILTFNRD